MAEPNLNVTAKDVMNTKVISARRDTSGRDIAVQLLSGAESGLPVVETDKKIIGVVTQFDLLKALEEGRDLNEVKAEEIMSTPPITVDEETSLRQIFGLMRKERILGVPVVRDQKLVGAVFRRDLLHHIMSPELLR